MEFKKVKLQDIVTILGDGIHGTPKYTENGEYYFINGNNLANGKIIIKSDTKTVDYEEYKKYKKDLNDRTLLVSINGTLGNVAVYNGEKCILGKSACYFNIKENVDKQYIQYILYSKEFQKYIQDYATGTTIKNMSLKAMREYEFILPEIEVQNKITKILSGIDKKIELNNQINDNLHNLAEQQFTEIYKYGSKAVLEDLLENVSTGSRPKGGAQSTGIPSVGAEKIEKFGVYDYSSEKYISEDFYDKLKNGRMKSGDVLLYKDGAYTGKVSMCLNGFPHKKSAVNEHVFILNTKNNWAQNYLYFTLFNKENKEMLERLAGAKAAQPGLNQIELKSLKINICNKETIENFEIRVKPIMESIANNSLENKKLAELRDTLLPKLMNGEIDLDKIEI